jgi:predicted RNA-binding protein YlxR (DUF448 family)
METKTCSDVKRKIKKKKLLRLTAPPKQVIVMDATRCNPHKLKIKLQCLHNPSLMNRDYLNTVQN